MCLEEEGGRIPHEIQTTSNKPNDIKDECPTTLKGTRKKRTSLTRKKWTLTMWLLHEKEVHTKPPPKAKGALRPADTFRLTRSGLVRGLRDRSLSWVAARPTTCRSLQPGLRKNCFYCSRDGGVRAGRPPGRKCCIFRADQGYYAPRVPWRVWLDKKEECGREGCTGEGFRSQSSHHGTFVPDGVCPVHTMMSKAEDRF